MRMPDEWPILEAKDFCRGVNDNGLGQHCLLGWFRVAAPRFLDVGDAVMNAAVAVGANTPPYTSVILINDALGNTKAVLARIWNRVGCDLGYVVGNPECDAKGNLKPYRKGK